MARLIALMLVLALACFTLGCNGGRETDEVTFVISIGLDAAPGGQINVTYRVARPTALGGQGGGGGGDKESSTVVTITAPSLAVARDLLNTVLARTANLSHIKAIVVGEELARKGLGDVIGPLARFREFRGSMFIFVAHGTTAENILRTNKPDLEKLASRYIEGMMATAGETGYYPRTFFHDFYNRLKAGSGSPFAVLFGLNPLTGEGAPPVPPATGEKTGEYLPDSVSRRDGNPAAIIGTALFRGDKLVGVLTSEETRMLAILTGEFRRGFLTVQDPLEPDKGINIHIRPGGRPKIKATLADGRPVIAVDVLVEGEITGLPSGINYEAPAYNRLLEEQISQVIRRDMLKTIRYTQEVGSDPVNFGKYFRRFFRTYGEFQRFDFDSRYPTAEIDVKVTTQLRRTGLMLKTSPLRERD